MSVINQLYLRDTRPDDVDLILAWENNSENWSVSGTTEKYSREEIEFLIHELNLPEQREQTRQMICLEQSHEAIGAVDLFSIEPELKIGSVGILIADKKNRRKGFASEALLLVEKIAADRFNLLKLECSIHSYNTASLNLFRSVGYGEYKTDDGLVFLEKWLKK